MLLDEGVLGDEVLFFALSQYLRAWDPSPLPKHRVAEMWSQIASDSRTPPTLGDSSRPVREGGSPYGYSCRNPHTLETRTGDRNEGRCCWCRDRKCSTRTRCSALRQVAIESPALRRVVQEHLLEALVVSNGRRALPVLNGFLYSMLFRLLFAPRSANAPFSHDTNLPGRTMLLYRRVF